MDLNRLQVFQKIVEAGNLTRAGKELSLPKSRVSRILSSLEKDLGPLIHRTTREMRLTNAGAQLYEKCKAPLDDLRSALENIHKHSTALEGLIRLTTTFDLGLSLLPEILAKFQRQHPNVHFDILLNQNIVDLVHESVDVAIRIGPLQNSPLKSLRVGSVKLVLAASPTFLQRHSVKHLEEIENLPTLSFIGKNKSLWTLSDGKTKVPLKINPRVTSNDPDLLISLARLHEGIALLPEFLCHQAFRQGELIHLFRSWSSESSTVHLVHPYKKEMPLRVRRFFDFLSAELPKHL